MKNGFPLARVLTIKTLILFAFLTLISCTPVKESAVAGSFYPADKKELQEMVDKFLARAENNPVEGELVSILSPHAGYVFSGHVAAHGYKHLKDVDTVIIIGQSHKEKFNGAAVYNIGAFRTPLGDVDINEELVASLINPQMGVTFYPEAFAEDHTIEVQLPFLQTVLDDFEIVPILMGIPSPDTYAFLADRLTAILRERNAIIVASSDLSHYHDYDTAVEMDKKLTDALSTLMGDRVEEVLMKKEGEMCGGPPALLTLEVSRRLGANKGVLFKYANSGDVSLEKNRVVGYASMGFYRTPLKEKDKEELVSIARKAIIGKVKYGKTPEVFSDNPRLHAWGAAFVTIKRQGMLRGCIGHIWPVMPLIQSVRNNAVAASSYDRRFPPMSVKELLDMDIEVSVLSPLEPLNDQDDLVVGKHGLYLVKGDKVGILLPQVPVEQGWDRQKFLEQIGVKAGLDEEAWKDADLYTFTAEVFRDKVE